MNQPDSDKRNDRQLLNAAAKGDETAIRDMIEQHQAMVYRTCLRMLGNEADAKDATQATFILFTRKLNKLPQKTVLGGWLYRSAQHVSREHIRSSSRRKQREMEAEQMKDTPRTSHEELWKDLAPKLDSILVSLPRKYRDVIVLRYLDEKSTNEAADMLGISSSAVTTRLARALELMRSGFQKNGMVCSTGALAVMLTEQASAAHVPAELAPAITASTGAGVAANAISEPVGLLVESAGFKLNALLLIEFIMFIGWIDCMVSWIKGGFFTPRWVHVFALILTLAGCITTLILASTGILTPPLAAGCLIIPPLAAYGGWLWMFGPEWSGSQ